MFLLQPQLLLDLIFTLSDMGSSNDRNKQRALTSDPFKAVPLGILILNGVLYNQNRKKEIFTSFQHVLVKKNSTGI